MMHSANSGSRGFPLTACLLTIIFTLMLSPPVLVLAQQGDYATYATARLHAFQLMEESKYTEAVPILEKLAAQNPKDGQVLYGLAFSLLVSERNLEDPTARKQMRARARSFFVRAKEAGESDTLSEKVLNSVPPDGGEDSTFSRNAVADVAMREAEAAFSRGDLDKALESYARALQLDSKLYEAAVFAGDMEFKKGYSSTDAQFRSVRFDKAGEWFAKAIAIASARETAYRYWGDALLAQGNMEEARAKFVEAIIAEPYNRLSSVGLIKWAQQNNIGLAHPKIEIPSNVSSSKRGEVKITVEELALKPGDSDGSSAWLMYGIARAGWMDNKTGRSEKFAKAYPNGKAYRHSLAEEFDALGLVVESLRTQTKEKRVKKLTPSLENLLKLSDAGLLEAYILFARADEGIARDYGTYRAANRDKLRRYWNEFVIQH